MNIWYDIMKHKLLNPNEGIVEETVTTIQKHLA